MHKWLSPCINSYLGIIHPQSNKQSYGTFKCEQSFNKLKELCSSTPILAYVNFSLPFKLHTDASRIGLGKIPYQEQDGKDRVITIMTRSLGKSESKYPAHKLKFLALKSTVTDKFHEYLYGNHFDVYTDNNPLSYVPSGAKPDAVDQRWAASFENYNFNIHYKPGTNVEADALSQDSLRWRDVYWDLGVWYSQSHDISSCEWYHVIYWMSYWWHLHT